jgi:hypothetical protein
MHGIRIIFLLGDIRELSLVDTVEISIVGIQILWEDLSLLQFAYQKLIILVLNTMRLEDFVDSADKVEVIFSKLENEGTECVESRDS